MGFFSRKKEVEKSNKLYKEYSFDAIGQHHASWNNTYRDSQNYSYLTNSYNNLAEVAAPINFYADNSSQVLFDIQKAKKIIDSHWLSTLMLKPNYYQNYGEFISAIIMQRLLYSNVYIYAESAETVRYGKIPNSLYLLPPSKISIELNKKSFIDNSIKSYIYDEKTIISPEKILHLKGTNPNFNNSQYLYGLSNLVSVNKNIQSLEEGYSAKVGIYKHGPRVVMSSKGGGMGEIGVFTDDTQNIKEKIATEYGLTEGLYQILVTDMPLDVHVIGKNIKELAIVENNLSDFQKICSVLSIPSLILSDNEGATFANVKEAKTMFFNGVFKSLVNSTFEALTLFFKQFEKEIEIVPDFSNIPEILEVEKKEQANLIELCKLGLITRNELLIMLGYSTINNSQFNENLQQYNW